MLNSKSNLKPCVPDDEVSFQFSDLTTNPQFVIGNEVSIDYIKWKSLEMLGLYLHKWVHSLPYHITETVWF